MDLSEGHRIRECNGQRETRVVVLGYLVRAMDTRSRTEPGQEEAYSRPRPVARQLYNWKYQRNRGYGNVTGRGRLVWLS